MSTIAIGELAPDFTLANENDEQITLSHLRGKKVVIYFYPKDHTPGCTKEACDFRDHFDQFIKNNVIVLGISKDSSRTHQKFKTKHDLPFSLLADVNGDVCAAYGVIDKKSLFGKTFLGIKRTTVLIDENGIIREIWRQVKVPGHVEQVSHASK